MAERHPPPGGRGEAHRARKRFGQNFLHDPNVIRRIVAGIAPRPDDAMVEIGPGLGALTAELLEAGVALHAVELDRDLIPRLQASFGTALTLHEADALKFDFCALAGGRPLRVVGNLPYNISTPLIFHLLAQARCVRDMHFMLQQEVVDRLAAAPGSGAYGRLSVMVQYHCRVERLFTVPPGAFRPAPKVWSAIVRLVPYREPPVAVREVGILAELVARAFSQRRKTLRNSLKGYLDGDAIAAAGVDPGRRPETLALHEFAALANAACQSTP